MIDTFSATELAELSIKNLPKTRQAIEYRAKKENWPFEYIKASGRNGGQRRYVLNGLPAEIQTAIREKQIAELLAQAAPAPLPSVVKKKRVPARSKLEQLGLPLNEYNLGLTDKQEDCAHARMVLVHEVLKMHNMAMLCIKEAVVYVVQQIETGKLPEKLAMYVPIANARSNKKRGVSVRTLSSWVAAYREAKTPQERMAALAPQMPKKERAPQQIEWLGDWLRVWADPNKQGLSLLYKVFVREYAAKNSIDACPSIDQVRYVHNKLPEIVRQRGRMTGGAYKAILPYVKRDWLIFKPDDIWVGDGHGFKAKVAHPIHGQPFQPEITAIIDAATRYVVGWTVSLAESTIAHADALRISMTKHEPPLMYYTDNGAGPTGKMVDADITGILPRLGIDHPTGLPGNPQGRGIIERLWETVTIPLARTYPTFIGEGADNTTKTLNMRKLNSAMNAEQQGKELSVEQRRYKAMLPSFKQFLADLGQAFFEYNQNHEHRELLKASNGKHGAPAAYRAARMAELGKIDEPLSEIELNLMFRPEEIRTVSRGLVSLFGNTYFSMELAALHNEKVRVGYDLHDADTVMIKRMDGGFVCKAKWNSHVQAAMPVSRIEQKRKERVNNRVKRQEDKIALAKMELQPAIEMQPDFAKLVGNGMPVIEADYVVLENDSQPQIAKPLKYKMFED